MKASTYIHLLKANENLIRASTLQKENAAQFSAMFVNEDRGNVLAFELSKVGWTNQEIPHTNTGVRNSTAGHNSYPPVLFRPYHNHYED